MHFSTMCTFFPFRHYHNVTNPLLRTHLIDRQVITIYACPTTILLVEIASLICGKALTIASFLILAQIMEQYYI